MINNFNYITFQYWEVDLIDFNQIIETSKDNLVLSYDGLLSVIKWSGDTIPSSINNLTTKSQIYSQQEIIEIMSQPEWVGTYSGNTTGYVGS